MGYIAPLLIPKPQEQKHFQFPLWDTSKPFTSNSSGLNVFQFPLWDTKAKWL